MTGGGPGNSRASELRRRLEQSLATLTPEQRSRLEQAGVPDSGSDAIPRRAADARIPLTHAQELLWLLDRGAPGLAAYNLPRVHRLRGKLDLDALQRALDAIVVRHEIFRTAFVAGDGGPEQQVRAPFSVPLSVIDLVSAEPAAKDREADRAITEAIRAPLALDSGRLLRAAVVRVLDGEQILVIVTHHIASDGWSRSIFETELAAHYEAALAHRDATLPVPPLQFADYAVWHRAWLSGDRLERMLAYWRTELTDAPQLLEIPTDRPRSALPRFEGARVSRSLSPELSARLAEFSTNTGATPFMVLLAAFHALLAKYAGQDDVLVAVPMAQRQRPELEKVIGYLVNTLPIRSRPAPAVSFLDLVAQVRRASLAADDHREVPFELMALTIGNEGGGRSLQLQASFTLAGGDAGPRFSLAGLTPLSQAFDPGWAKFELSLTVVDQHGQLRTTLEYRSDLYQESSALRMLDHYERLLTQALTAPDRPLGQLSLLNREERQLVQVDWNATDAPVPERATVHGLIGEQTRRTPHAVAVELDDASLTYAELDRRAERVARHLRRLGVGPDVPVGICFEASLDMPVAFLGVLKAGGVCLPLDPAYPVERLEFMISDAATPVVLTSRSLVGDLPTRAAQIVCLDRDWDEIDAETPTPLPRQGGPDTTAYLLYTSGSTGRPRGVLLPHRGLVNHNLGMIAVAGTTSADRVAQLASLSFDISMEEMLPTWIAGGTVVLRPRNLPLLGPDFERWLIERRITVLDLATAHWHEWVNTMAEGKGRVPGSLRLVIIGGEKGLGSVYRRWREVAPAQVRLINSYGPTETSCVVTTWEPPADPDDLPGDFLLGRPLQNTRAYVLDQARQPVPIGLPGELYIGGRGLAVGYLNLPEVTAARFLADPFDPRLDARMYATGDRVRWLPDGTLEFLGRTDHQVKIRGFRVELGEVESALSKCPGVREAVVILREDEPGRKQLVGYYVPRGDTPLAEPDLRAALRATLAEYMVPTSLVPLAAIPLTPNGKLDRRALPPPPLRTSPKDERTTPSTLQTALLTVWESLFPGRAIGLHDDFFDLGGHSLLAARMVDEVHRGTGFSFPITALYEGATIAKLEQYLLRNTDPKGLPDIIELRKGAGGPDLFLLHGDMTGGGFYAREIARALPADQGFYVLPPRPVDNAPGSHTIEGMARLHLPFIRRVQPAGPYMISGYCVGGLVALEIARQLRAEGEDVSLLLVLDTSIYNVRYLWIWSLLKFVTRKARKTAMAQDALLAYLAARLRRIGRLSPWPLFLYLAGFPFRFLGRRYRRWQRSRTPAPTQSAPTAPVMGGLHQVLAAHDRAMLAYMPTPYAGRIDLVRAVPSGQQGADPSRGWNRISPKLCTEFIVGTHHGFLLSALPQCVAAAVARVRAETTG
ncbi:MAG TPA: amino acid adenylation domain-containing protein [Gemmatimonadales bacterium]|nr:amino acid adenylation domain-containing protein [Gemmatimonadales bacterium]